MVIRLKKQKNVFSWGEKNRCKLLFNYISIGVEKINHKHPSSVEESFDTRFIENAPLSQNTLILNDIIL